MRIVRILLLVLLAVTLPVRGVMAAAMLCPPPAGMAGQAHVDEKAVAGPHDHGEMHAPHHAEAGTPAADHHHDGTASADTCNLCSACCSVPPVPAAALSVPVPHDFAAADFPRLSAPAPRFVSDGQERPPRSI